MAIPSNWILSNGLYYAPINWNFKMPVIFDDVHAIDAKLGNSVALDGLLRIVGFEYRNDFTAQKDTPIVIGSQAIYAILEKTGEGDTLDVPELQSHIWAVEFTRFGDLDILESNGFNFNLDSIPADESGGHFVWVPAGYECHILYFNSYHLNESVDAVIDVYQNGSPLNFDFSCSSQKNINPFSQLIGRPPHLLNEGDLITVKTKQVYTTSSLNTVKLILRYRRKYT
jgi:hypothetical protein